MCLTPIKIKAKKRENGMVRMSGNSIVPCGKCPECKMRRAQSWIFRLLQEEKIHKNALFVTLTYAPENTPMSKNGFMTLCKRDYQLFMKRLRKFTRINTIKYYACGEYGGDTWRPHYHAIIYDCPPDAIDKCWGLGHIVIGDVNGNSVAYTTKYICKDKKVPIHSNDDRVPEFSLMSKRLGSNYLTWEMVAWHQENDASYVVVPGGYKNVLPRYYRDFIFTDEQKERLNTILQLRKEVEFNAAVKAAGSQKEFYRNRFEFIRESISKKPVKRNKI